MGNSRDTQFACFGKLLYEELAQNVLLSDKRRLSEIEDFKHEQELIVARRVYDLVEHTIANIVPNDIQQSTNQKSIAEIVETIPDMTKWPDID